MMGVLWNIASFVVALGILIAVHEWGHFWVARRCGVKVERFAIGFGKPLWRWMGRDGTEYVIAAVPLGGYVKMLDERIEEVPEALRHQAFNNKSVWQRMAIVAAGPGANFLFAVFAFWLMFLIGVPGVRPVVDQVMPGSIAAEAGVPGQFEITSVSGQAVDSWEEAHLELVSHMGESELVLRGHPLGSTLESRYRLDLSQWQFDPERDSPLASLGLQPVMATLTLTLAEVMPDSAAAQAGLKVGDRLLRLDGQPLRSWQQLVDTVQQRPGEVLALQLERGPATQTLTVKVGERIGADGVATGYLGVAPVVEPLPDSYLLERQYGPLKSLWIGLDKTWALMALTVKMVGKLVTGDVSLSHLSGPISIAKGAGSSAEYGLVYFLSFLALISVNLGIINLFPLPVLDGGHLFFFAIEALTGRPVPEKIQEIGFKIGVMVLLILMSIALFNDFTRL